MVVEIFHLLFNIESLMMNDMAYMMSRKYGILVFF